MSQLALLRGLELLQFSFKFREDELLVNIQGLFLLSDFGECLTVVTRVGSVKGFLSVLQFLSFYPMQLGVIVGESGRIVDFGSDVLICGLSNELPMISPGDVIADIFFCRTMPVFFETCLLELLSKIDQSVGFFVLLSSEVELFYSSSCFLLSPFVEVFDSVSVSGLGLFNDS